MCALAGIPWSAEYVFYGFEGDFWYRGRLFERIGTIVRIYTFNQSAIDEADTRSFEDEENGFAFAKADGEDQWERMSTTLAWAIENHYVPTGKKRKYIVISDDDE
jgi:hypothetical protein